MPQHELFEALEEVHEGLTETIKQVANEPSVGLYFVQQHVHKAVPALLDLKTQLADATIDVELCTADAKDALSSIKTMKGSGPSVIDQMIKTLNSANSLILTPRQVRGSTSQLFSKPARPVGVTRGPLRTTSHLGDWHSNTSRNKQLPPSGNSSESSASDAMNNHKALMSVAGPSEIVHNAQTLQEPVELTSTFLDGLNGAEAFAGTSHNTSKKELSSTVPELSTGEADKAPDNFVMSALQTATLRATNLGWMGLTSSGSPTLTRECQDEDTARWKSTRALKDVHVGSPASYMRAVLDSALSKAETVSRESARLLKGDTERQTSDSKLVEKRNWLQLPSHNFLGFGGRNQIIPPATVGEAMPGETETMNIENLNLLDNFEQFQAAHVAKLEAWLSESDGGVLEAQD